MGWEEKRQFKRAYVKLMVECRGKSSWQMVEAKDISAGGMFVATDKPEPRDSIVEIMFEVGTDEKNKRFVRAEGKVVWSKPKATTDEQGNAIAAGMGIQFVKLNPLSSKSYIDELVKKLEEDKDA